MDTKKLESIVGDIIALGRVRKLIEDGWKENRAEMMGLRPLQCIETLLMFAEDGVKDIFNVDD